MEKKTIEQVIAEEGKYICTTSGISMKPLFADRRDTIIILPAKGRLKKYDVPLYRRGDEYVLHRIVKVLPDSYVICGDNCEKYEFGISDNDVIGFLYAFYRKNKYYTVDYPLYKLYSFYVVNTFSIRIFFRKAKRFLVRIYKILLRK